MSDLKHNRNGEGNGKGNGWLFLATLLATVVLLVSMGARSAAFHAWLHGDGVACALAHDHRGGGESDDGSSENGDPKTSDPLQPFCQAGLLFQVEILDLGLEQAQLAELTLRPVDGLSSRPLSPSSPPRAPPHLV